MRDIEKFLAKGHRPFCAIKNTENKRCTCGLEAAQEEFEKMRAEIIELRKARPCQEKESKDLFTYEIGTSDTSTISQQPSDPAQALNGHRATQQPMAAQEKARAAEAETAPHSRPQPESVIWDGKPSKSEKE